MSETQSQFSVQETISSSVSELNNVSSTLASIRDEAMFRNNLIYADSEERWQLLGLVSSLDSAIDNIAQAIAELDPLNQTLYGHE